MGLLKGLWQDLAIDAETVAAWHELMAEVDYRDAKEAVLDHARAGGKRPSAAEVYAASRTAAGRRIDRERASQ
jgi:hypothetical protein